MNEKKISFIVCVNNENYVEEQSHYLKKITVPPQYQIEIIEIRDAISMTAGYNEGMNASNAKYKVYMHQDAFIVNPNFIQDILNIFSDKSIGMIGMVGSPKLPENSIMWNGPRVGKLYYNSIYEAGESVIGEFEGEYEEVEAIDGFMMITQYDIKWREDLFKNWDFYDISQSQEFIKAGYKVVVPNQKNPWCIHDDGFFNLKNYYENRKIFQREYKSNIIID